MTDARRRLIARRSRSTADIAIWASLVLIGAVLLTLSNFGRLPAGDSVGSFLIRLRILGTAPRSLGDPVAAGTVWWDPLLTSTPPLAVFAAAAVAFAVLVPYARGQQDRLGWWQFQAAAAGLAALWTMALVVILDADADSDAVTTLSAPAGPPLGRLLSTWSDELLLFHPVIATIGVGILAGVAVGLLNAGVQSLCGETQARRFAAVAVLSPAAGWYGESATAVIAVLSVGTLTLAAMASERGRGAAWTLGLGSVSGVLLGAAVLTAYQCSAIGVGMLSVYFLRRRPMTILVSGLGLGIALIVAGSLGWSWAGGFPAADDLGGLSELGPHLAGIVCGVVAVAALCGPVFVTSWRKVRNTPAWPLMLTAVCAVAVVLIFETRTGSWVAALLPWQPLLNIAAVAPLRPAGQPDGPGTILVGATALAGILLTVLCRG